MSDTESPAAPQPVLGAIVLFSAALVALGLANSRFGTLYNKFWHAAYSLPGGLVVTGQEVVDKGLMALFFLAVGLELKRELVHGALRHPKAMALPLIAALGGMVTPAFVYYSLNSADPGLRGWAIPMSTDIAFAIGALAILGRRVPRNLMLFLLALAVVDDLGAILVIAFYYTRTLSTGPLLISFGILISLILLNRRQVQSLFPYLGMGTLLWLALGYAGISAPLAGVLVAAAIPASAPASSSPVTSARRLEQWLASPVTFGVMPLFAFANAGLVFSGQAIGAQRTIAAGIFFGLLLGKFFGIAGAAWLALRWRLAHLPSGVSYRHILGVAWLGGIGFTMALFLDTLAFGPGAERMAGKLGILIASPLSAAIGTAWLYWCPPKTASAARPPTL